MLLLPIFIFSQKEKKETVFILFENNSKETSNAILELLDADRNEMRINSKVLAKEYDWSIIAKKFEKYYSSLL